VPARSLLGALIRPEGYPLLVAEETGKPLDQRLEEIGAQLAWVRDYL
jgi:hypothetical protein